MKQVSEDVFWDRVRGKNFHMIHQDEGDHPALHLKDNKTLEDIGVIHIHYKNCPCCHSILEERECYLIEELAK